MERKKDEKNTDKDFAIGNDRGFYQCRTIHAGLD